MILAGDLGGTKTLVGLFEPTTPADRHDHDARPRMLATREYRTLDFDSLDAIVAAFRDETRAARIQAASIGVAGPVTGMVARLTNVPWLADATAVAEELDGCPVQLLNDLEAMAYAIPVLEPDETAVLQTGVAVAGGNAALIAAGTGLGQAVLHNVAGRFVPLASEGGHADFSARTRRELALVERLAAIYGRVDCERVISGHGLVNLFRFTHGTDDTAGACAVVGDAPDADLPAAVTTAALAHTCEACVEALDMFIDAYGAEAGNLALRAVATAGLYIGGGIAPKILPALECGPFLEAFRAKDPLADLLRMIPVSIILNAQAGLVGAAVHAATLR